MRLRKTVIQLDRAFQGPHRLSVPAKLFQDIAEIVVEPRVSRRQGERAAVDGERLFVASLAAKRASFPVERRHPLRAVRERPIEGIGGQRPAPLSRQRMAEIERGLRVTGCEGEDAPEARFRLCRPAEAEQHHPLIEGRVCRARLEKGRLAIGGQRRLEVGAMLEHESEMQVSGGRTRIRGNRPAQKGEGLSGIPALMTEQAEVVERPRVAGRPFEDLPVQGFGLGEATRAMQGEPALQIRLGGHA